MLGEWCLFILAYFMLENNPAGTVYMIASVLNVYTDIKRLGYSVNRYILVLIENIIKIVLLETLKY